MVWGSNNLSPRRDWNLRLKELLSSGLGGRAILFKRCQFFSCYFLIFFWLYHCHKLFSPWCIGLIFGIFVFLFCQTLQQYVKHDVYGKNNSDFARFFFSTLINPLITVNANNFPKLHKRLKSDTKGSIFAVCRKRHA